MDFCAAQFGKYVTIKFGSLCSQRLHYLVENTENMDPSWLVTTVQAGGGGVMVWGMFSWHTLVPIGLRLNATAYLSIVSDHVHPFMATM